MVEKHIKLIPLNYKNNLTLIGLNYFLWFNHIRSMSVSSEYLNFDGNTKISSKRISFDYNPHDPVNAYTSNTLQTLQFKLNYKDTPFIWEKSYLEFGYQILAANRETPIASDDIVFVVNNAWSRFKNMYLKINGETINSIDRVWLVNHINSLGMFSRNYSKAALQDMDFLIDQERICRESYAVTSYNSFYNVNADGIPIPEGSLGLFDEVTCSNCTITNAAPGGGNVKFIVKIASNTIKNLDISTTTDYYVGWLATFGNIGIKQPYQNKLFVITAHTYDEPTNTTTIEFSVTETLNDPVTGAAFDAAGNTTSRNVPVTIIMPNHVKTQFNSNLSAAAARSLQYHNSKVSYKRLQLPFSLLFGEVEKVLQGFEWELYMELENDARCLFTASSTQFTANIFPLTPKLFVAVPKLNTSEMETVMARQLLNGSLTIPFRKYYTYEQTYQSVSAGTYNIQGFTSQSKPLQMFIMFHNNSGITPPKDLNQNYNPLLFDNLSISKLTLSTLDWIHPEKQPIINFIEPTQFSDKPVNFNQFFQLFLEAYDADLDFNSDAIGGISKKQFQDLYPIFSFDLEQRSKNSDIKGGQNVEYTIDFQLGGTVAQFKMFIIIACERHCVINYNNRAITIETA